MRKTPITFGMTEDEQKVMLVLFFDLEKSDPSGEVSLRDFSKFVLGQALKKGIVNELLAFVYADQAGQAKGLELYQVVEHIAGYFEEKDNAFQDALRYASAFGIDDLGKAIRQRQREMFPDSKGLAVPENSIEPLGSVKQRLARVLGISEQQVREMTLEAALQEVQNMRYNSLLEA